MRKGIHGGAARPRGPRTGQRPDLTNELTVTPHAVAPTSATSAQLLRTRINQANRAP